MAQCIQRGLHQLQRLVAEHYLLEFSETKGERGRATQGQALKRHHESRCGSPFVAQALVLRRLASDSPEALLANQYERLSIYRAFRQAVGEHG